MRVLIFAKIKPSQKVQSYSILRESVFRLFKNQYNTRNDNLKRLAKCIIIYNDNDKNNNIS